MKKLISAISVALCLCVLLTACHTSFSYTFTISTGDKVKVSLDTTDGHKLTQKDGVFAVSDKDGIKMLEGVFVTEEQYDAYEEAINEKHTVLESEKGFTNYQLENGEYGFLLWLYGSATGVIMAGGYDLDSARTAYDLLTITANPED